MYNINMFIQKCLDKYIYFRKTEAFIQSNKNICYKDHIIEYIFFKQSKILLNICQYDNSFAFYN